MSKEQIESILNANTYLIKCKGENKCKKTYDCARKYLNLTVDKVLCKSKKKTPKTVFFSLIAFIISFTN